jgi:hypothetical protein
MTKSSADRQALSALLRAQDGLISLDQARSLGMTPSALGRRIHNPASGWSRVLPRVYLQGVRDLDDRQRCRAAVLFAGDGATLTGVAALRWHRIPHLPVEASLRDVDVVVPPGRQLRSVSWARLHRSARPDNAYSLDGVRTMPVTRAIVDAAPVLSDTTVLAVMCAAVNDRRTDSGRLADELSMAPIKGSRAVRQALAELTFGARSVPEADARGLFLRAGLPLPLINQPLSVAGRLLVPDFRWGHVIVEIDSKAFHLLQEGAWDRTQERRAFLRAHGYLVIPVTPKQLRERPDEVIAEVLRALGLVAGR